VEEAHREMSTIAKAVTTTLESLPDILERDCGIDADSVARVQDIIDSMRQQLYERIIDDESDE
jgi:Na+/phosphate symporter